MCNGPVVKGIMASWKECFVFITITNMEKKLAARYSGPNMTALLITNFEAHLFLTILYVISNFLAYKIVLPRN